MSLIIGLIMKDMDRDRNIAMGLGSNTYASATLTNHIKKGSLSILLTSFTLHF